MNDPEGGHKDDDDVDDHDVGGGEVDDRGAANAVVVLEKYE